MPDQEDREGAEPYYGEEAGRLFLRARERGKLVLDEDHGDVESLVAAIVTRAAVGMAMDYEVRHRRPNEDSRRQWFHLGERWLGRVEPAWGDRLHEDHARVLQSAPFVDTHEQRMASIVKAEAEKMEARRHSAVSGGPRAQAVPDDTSRPDRPAPVHSVERPPVRSAGRPEWVPWTVVVAVGFGLCGLLRVIEAVVDVLH
ncbi:MAG: Imm63 family immunity protein [Janibacter sp.]